MLGFGTAAGQAPVGDGMLHHPVLPLFLLLLLARPPDVATEGESATWCPKYSFMPGVGLYDPSAPIQVGGTWHWYSWPHHFSSTDLVHWRSEPNVTAHVGGLTGSISSTESGLVLLHPKGARYIARAALSGSDLHKLNDFDDSTCCEACANASACPHGHCAAVDAEGCVATQPAAMGAEWQFMDPSRAVQLSDGRWYVACGAGCQHACKPTDILGIPWYRATDSSEKTRNLL